MSAKHTPGLLNIVTQYAQPELRAASGELVAVVADYEVEDARRLAACWNACDGMETQQVEQISQQGETLASRLALHVETEAKLISQRDELLMALKELLGPYAAKPCEITGMLDLLVCGEDISAARAAIAKAIG